MNESLISSPIGVFDSGVGGLSVVKAIMQLLPSEDILYFADTQHIPYGNKTLSEIREYSRVIIEFLISQNCKIIVVACNTATAAIDSIMPELSKKIKIFNVIDPVVQHVTQNYQNCKVGLLCTDLTYEIGIFEKKIESSGKNIRLISFKASQLAHLIESEFDNKSKLKQLIKEYLFNHRFLDVQAMILGCTHYFWLKEDFLKLNPYINWIEPTKLVAQLIKEYLDNNISSPYRTKALSKATFCQSGHNENFYKLAKNFTPDNYQINFLNFYWPDRFNIHQNRRNSPRVP